MSNETNFPNNSNHPQSANIPVSSLAPFKRFCCSLGMIPSSYKASMSYEEQLMWLCDYLENTVIPTVNNNTEATNEIQELFNQLHDYVENYFTNLDVQQEINNKLDEMASDGTLISIVAPYLQPFIDEQNNRISQVENFVYATTNINPLVASSISDMTDTTRIYVLTTDGHWYYWNGSEWADGGAYQSTQLITDKTLSEYNQPADAKISGNYGYNINMFSRMIFNNILPLTNYCDGENSSHGKFYKEDSNTHLINLLQNSSSANYYAIPPFPVKKGVKYRCSAIPATTFSYLTDNKGFVIENGIVKDTSSQLNFTPTEDGIAYITYQSQTTEPVNPYIYVYDFQPTNFIPFLQVYDFLLLGESLIKKINVVENNIYVGSNKDYATIAQAIASITDTSIINNIIIDDGTYQEKNLTLPTNTNIIGASGNYANCIIQGYNEETATDSQISSSSTFNISGNNKFKNVTITCQNMRYPIHSESQGSVKNWKQYVENCFIEHLGNQEVIDYRIANSLDYSNVWSSCHGWGEGASSGAYLEITNSTIKSVMNAFYVHGASNMTEPYTHIIKNTKLISHSSSKFSVYVDDNSSSIANNTLIIEDCFLSNRVGIIGGSYNYNMLISGSGLVPIYQKPQQVLLERSFPIFTDYIKEYKCAESLNKGNFVYTTDGETIHKATSSTNKKLIIGYVVGTHSQGDYAKVMCGYLQPTSQNWPETPIQSNIYYKLATNGALEQTNILDEAIAISNNYCYKLFI